MKNNQLQRKYINGNNKKKREKIDEKQMCKKRAGRDLLQYIPLGVNKLQFPSYFPFTSDDGNYTAIYIAVFKLHLHSVFLLKGEPSPEREKPSYADVCYSRASFQEEKENETEKENAI